MTCGSACGNECNWEGTQRFNLPCPPQEWQGNNIVDRTCHNGWITSEVTVVYTCEHPDPNGI